MQNSKARIKTIDFVFEEKCTSSMPSIGTLLKEKGAVVTEKSECVYGEEAEFQTLLEYSDNQKTESRIETVD